MSECEGQVVETLFADVGDLRQRILEHLEEEVVKSVAHLLHVLVHQLDGQLDGARAQTAQQRHDHLAHLWGGEERERGRTAPLNKGRVEKKQHHIGDFLMLVVPISNTLG